MLLEDSCHCGAVPFSVNSRTPCPFNDCYCPICRKTTGGGGFAINLMGDAPSLRVEGGRNLAICRATIDGETSTAMRQPAVAVGSALARPGASPRLGGRRRTAGSTRARPPHAGIETRLVAGASPRERHFDGYPEETIEDWHRSRNLLRPVIVDSPAATGHRTCQS